MMRLSIQTREKLARLTLPVLIAASFGVMLLGKADAVLAERARMALADALGPIYAWLAQPLAAAKATLEDAGSFWSLRAENTRLRAENEQLRQWQSIALSLDAENQRLKANLNWVPDPELTFVTVRAVADAGGAYAKAVLLAVGPNHGIRKGEIALDQRGLVGRVTEVGLRTVRVLLITDLNSRVPVLLEKSGGRAIAAGANGPQLRLMYWSDGTPQEGERVVTSGDVGAFPAQLPVGTVHYNSAHVPEIEPAARLDELEIVRVFDYALPAAAPETARAAERRR